MTRLLLFLGLMAAWWSTQPAFAVDPNFQCGVRTPRSLVADWSRRRAQPAAIPANGIKRLLLVRVDFSDLPGAPFTDLDGVNLFADADRFLAEMSVGRVRLAALGLVGTGSAITPTLRVPLPSTSYAVMDISKLREDALAAALVAGFGADSFDLDAVCFGPVSGPSFDFSGLANVGARGVWLRDAFFNGGNLVHELGHNFGLLHANGWNTSGGPPTGPGAEVEYADVSDTMSRNTGASRHYNAQKKAQLGWLTSDELLRVTESGVYRVYAQDVTNTAPGPKALVVAHSARTNYWLELRQKYVDQPAWTNGLAIRWAEDSPRPTLLLDTTPTSASGFRDAPLHPGWTFSDRAVGRHFRNRGFTPATEATPASLSVEIEFGNFPENHAPTASLKSSSESVGVGSMLTFEVVAADPDGDVLSYGWDFGDGTFGPDAASVARAYGTAGDYLVRCTISDGRGGTAIVQTPVRVGSVTTGRIDGRVLRPDGSGANGVFVLLSNGRSTQTDIFGRYLFTGLTPGDYLIRPVVELGVARPSQRAGTVPGSGSASVADFTAFAVSELRPVTLVPSGAAWRYLDTGSNPGPSWPTVGFNDLAWGQGPAPLGYGYPDLGTTVLYGPNPMGRWITTFFRRAFTVADPSEFLEGRLAVQWDDAVLISVNGHEVVRQNLPTGSVGVLTLPLVENSPAESTNISLVAFDAALLQSGTNVVTAEVHQWRPNDTDLRFELRLQGLTAMESVEPPTLLAGPLPLTLTEGQRGTLRVEAGGSEPLFFQWRRNGAELPGATNSVLDIAAAGAADVGDYDCRVSNSAGAQTSNAVSLGLQSTPGIVSSPNDLAVNEGAAALFTVRAVGLAPLRYQWLRNNTIIGGATNATYRIASARPNDAGVYRVIVSNGLGSVPSGSAVLVVYEKPRITQAPSGRLVLADRPFTLEVAASGSGPLSYQWFQDGALMRGATNALLAVTGLPPNPTMVRFAVTVANLAGSVTSDFAEVTIGFGPVISSGPTNITVISGQMASFAVSASGTSPLTYRWLRNATVVPGNTGARLDLSNVIPSDAGTYQVIVGGAAGFTTNFAQLTVLEPPRILAAPLALTRLAGESGELVVTVGGNPIPSLQWRKDGIAISGATSNRLAFEPLTFGDAGFYEVRVFNVAGETSSIPVSLTVLDPTQQVAPSIVNGPLGVALGYGQTTTLQVTVAGLPAPTVQWRKDGADLLDQTNVVLVLGPVTLDDVGRYSVVAANRNGVIESSPALVVVGSPPLFSIQPQSASLLAGVNRTLSVLASGDLPLGFQWLHDGQFVPGATNSDLRLRLVTELDAGVYRLVVRNPYGSSTSAPAQIQVFVPPKIAAAPQNTYVRAGQSAALTVGVTGTAPLIYTWRRAGSVVAILTNSPTLSFPEVTEAVVGTYTVTVANFASAVTAPPASVTIVIPVAIQSQPEGTNSIVGRAFALKVGVTGDAPITYQWRRNDQEVLNATNATLEFPSLSGPDEGTYTVLVGNPVATVLSLSAEIRVAIPPEILIPPATQVVATGTDVRFEVLATGTEPRSFQWFQNDRLLENVPNMAQLQLGQVSAANAGRYQVVVQNFAGSVTSAVAVLQILDSPRLVVSPTEQRVALGSSTAFSVTAEGGAPLQYQWRRHGTNLVGATNAILRFSAVTLADIDEYTVRVSNPVGVVVTTPVWLDVAIAAARARFESFVISESGAHGQLRGSARRSYRLESSSDLVTWTLVESVILGADGTADVDLSNSAERASASPRFFRALPR